MGENWILTLEIGCGSSKSLKASIAIDINRNSDCDVLADAHHLPFQNKSFMKVVFYEVLEHLDNPSLTLSEINRVLLKEGKLQFSIPNAMYWRIILRWIVKGEASVSLEHINCWRLPEIQNLLVKTKFRIVKYGFTDFPRHNPPSIFAKTLPRITKHSMLIKCLKVN